MNRFHVRRAGFAPAAVGFVSQPEPRTIGRFARGKQLCSGNFLFAGHLVEAPKASIWDLGIDDPGFAAELHGFVWLDDLAAVGDRSARQRAQAWTADWIVRYGAGPGWAPDITGRRLIRWINHAIFLLSAQDSAVSDAYFRSLGQQTVFLARRWHATSRGLPRFEALTGLIYAGLSLIGMESHVTPAIAALAKECCDRIDIEGRIPTRNPEELLEVFTLLTWAARALSEAGQRAPGDHIAAIERIAPTLRALRHADGGLARFHGGGRGLEGRLDHALATAGVRTGARPGLSMGFARLSAGRTSLIVDAAPPPLGTASGNAHASTLAFELTSGRRPLIVNCGSGLPFGPGWAQAGRATASHSTLSIDGYSSSRFGSHSKVGGRELLVNTPRDVRLHQSAAIEARGLVAGHDGYVATHGLTHARSVDLSADGRGIVGEDTLATVSDRDRPVFDAALDRSKLQGILFHIRFHLHPDVDTEVDMGGAAISLALKSGEIWVFRHDGVAKMALQPSVFLEKGRLEPRATKQVVLSARTLKYATRVCWTLAKAQGTPSHIRDLEKYDSKMMADT